MKKHILVISQYFYPEQFRINDICSEWVKRNYEVTVVTGIPNYPEGKFYSGYNLFKRRRESYRGVNIIRLPLIPRGKSSIFLALNYISFVISGFFWKTFTRVKADRVFIFEVSPMTQALVGVWYAKRREIPCDIYVQDLWPDNVEIVTGLSNKKILKSIGKLVDYVYKNCDKIFTTSKSFVKSIHARGVPLSKLEYWPQYAEEYYVPIESQKLDGEPFTITFAGNIGTAQGLEVLVEAANLLRSENIIFNIIGDGRYKKELESKVRYASLDNMFRFISQKPSEEIPQWLAKSHVAFLSFRDNPLFAMTVPAKLQSYMACGIPILACATGESAQIIEEAECGLCGNPGDVETLVRNVMTLKNLDTESLANLGKNARLYCEEHFSKDKLMHKMDQYFQNKGE